MIVDFLIEFEKLKVMKPLLVADEVFERHNPGPGHPESPQRVRVLLDMIEDEGFYEKFEKVPLREASEEEILLVHSKEHFERVKSADGKRVVFDPDTSTSPDSYRTALLAVGSCLNMIDAFLENKSEYGFAIVRPPGHHAERGRAMGFCLFNNVAICAEYAVKKGVGKVAIVDWDLHHGNGTQWIFWDRPDVLYISLHRYPYYPGTGEITETGEGRGRGATVNIPLPGGCGDEEYAWCFLNIVMPVLNKYKPELLFVSAGFDPHIDDPLGDMQVTERGFSYFAYLLKDFCKKEGCGGPFFILEGGYSLSGLRDSVEGVLRVLCGEKPEEIKGVINDFLKAKFTKALLDYWKV